MAIQFQDETVIIHRFICGPLANNTYLIVCAQTNQSIIIDLPEDARELIDTAINTEVQRIVITHNHRDHIQGYFDVTKDIKAPVGICQADADALPRPADFFIEHGSAIKAGTVTLKAIATPGHTPGSMSLGMGKHLFTGDTLFPGGPGRTQSPKDLRQIIQSIRTRLFVKDLDTIFYPGHGEGSTLRLARHEYGIFASKQHPDDLTGDVTWLGS